MILFAHSELTKYVLEPTSARVGTTPVLRSMRAL